MTDTRTHSDTVQPAAGPGISPDPLDASLVGAEGTVPSGNSTSQTEAATSASGPWHDLLDILPEWLAQPLLLGGPVTLVLLVLSMVAFAIILFKSIELYTERSRGKRRIAEALAHWQTAHRREALSILADAHRGVGKLVRIAMEGRLDPGVCEELVREEIQRLAAADMQKLRSHLRTLEVIGMISPLLGLLGTVLGMITAFRQLELAGRQVDPSLLSGGIWQALLTTGVGLAVAIPTVLAHSWLERRAERHAHRIEDAVTQVFTADVYSPQIATATATSRPARGTTHAA